MRLRGTVSVDPVWSPDGRTLAFAVAPASTFGGWSPSRLSRWYGGHRLLLYDVARGTTRSAPAARGATVPLWAPNGRSLLYVSGDGLWLLPGLGAKPVEIARPLFRPGHWPAYYGQVDWTGQFAWWSRAPGPEPQP